MANEARIILALDYGTTYTGVAFCSAADLNEGNWHSNIHTVTEWPVNRSDSKVPSAISYTPGRLGGKQYGFDIEGGSDTIMHTKLEFQPKSRSKEIEVLANTLESLVLSGNPAARYMVGRYYTKSAVEICRDYLERVAEAVLEALTPRINEFAAGVIPIDMVVTHPAIWDESARNQTFRAVTGAFRRSLFPTLRDIFFVSEPEACALYTLKWAQKEGTDRLRLGDVFVVCDAGGGTVDLVSFRVTQLSPVLELERVGHATGGNCGAIFIDAYFLNTWLKGRLTPDEYDGFLGEGSYRRPENFSVLGGRRVVQKCEQEFLEKFEDIKFEFGKDYNLDQSFLELPEINGELRRVEIEDDQARGMYHGSLAMTKADLSNIFNFSVSRTLELIDQQVTLASVMGYSVTCIYLSGGFGQNEYLFKKVRDFARSRGVAVQRGRNCRTAVMQGAILKAMGMGTAPPQITHRCLSHYGVSVSENFLEYRHLSENAYYDFFDHQLKAGDQMKWLISMNDPIPPGKPITATFEFSRKFGPRSATAYRICFVACNDERAPSLFSQINTDTSRVINIDYDLSQVPRHQLQEIRNGNEMYYKAVLRLEVQVQHHILLILTCSGTELNRQVAPL